jgi:HemK-like putative methylase
MYTKEQKWLLKEKYHDVESQEYRMDLARLAQGEPLAYIIGWVNFLGCHIDLSFRPLIPRVETEWWTEYIINEHKESKMPLQILDLCSGSGCIGIACAQHIPNAYVDCAEIDQNLIAQINKNIGLNGIDTNHARAIQSDLFSNISKQYDLILANPPYIDIDVSQVEPSVFAHEPHLALFADNGTKFIEQILREAKRFLREHGTLAIEFGELQSERLSSFATSLGYKTHVLNDQYGVERVLIAKT